MARLLHAKAGPLPSGVGGREPSANRRSKQSRTVGEVATTSAGAACTTEVNSVAGPVAITLRLTPRPMGQPRSGRKRCLMLELYASKGARTVLRGGGAGNSTSLPDIGVEPSGDITPRESGLTSLGCWRTGTDSQPARGAKQNCLGQQCPWCGPRRTSVAGPAAVPSRLTPRPMGQPRPVRGVVGRRSRARSCLAGALFNA
jgi:hypothetical protein